jgi:glyoxylate reductase
MSSILVTRRLPSSTVVKLEAAGEAEIHNHDEPLSHADLQRRIAGKDAVVTMLTDEINRTILDAGERLKIVANVAVGFNNVDVPYARSRGVIVTNTPDVLTESVAGFTWALILAITRRLAEGERIIRRGEWRGWAFDFLLGTDLKGKQLGLIGFGRIARAVAAKAAAFGMRVAYTTRRPLEAPGGEATPLSLDRLLNTSDVVSVHVPLTPETRHLLDRRALARMKRSAYLINTSRGPIVDEEALAWALEQHLIAGAALDVYEQEPAVHPALLHLENVLLSPHLGSGTTETRTAMADLAVENVLAVLAGGPPLTPV